MPFAATQRATVARREASGHSTVAQPPRERRAEPASRVTRPAPSLPPPAAPARESNGPGPEKLSSRTPHAGCVRKVAAQSPRLQLQNPFSQWRATILQLPSPILQRQKPLSPLQNRASPLQSRRLHCNGGDRTSKRDACNGNLAGFPSTTNDRPACSREARPVSRREATQVNSPGVVAQRPPPGSVSQIATHRAAMPNQLERRWINRIGFQVPVALHNELNRVTRDARGVAREHEHVISA